MVASRPQRRQPSTTAATVGPVAVEQCGDSSKKAAIYDGCNLLPLPARGWARSPQRRQPSTTAATHATTASGAGGGAPQRRQPSTTAATGFRAPGDEPLAVSSKKAAIYDGCNLQGRLGRPQEPGRSSKKAAIYDGCNHLKEQSWIK